MNKLVAIGLGLAVVLIAAQFDQNPARLGIYFIITRMSVLDALEVLS